MAYVFHANGIVTGTINSFCLACDSFLTSDEQANQHITQTLHKQKLNGVPYDERFKDEGIRKVILQLLWNLIALGLLLVKKKR